LASAIPAIGLVVVSYILTPKIEKDESAVEEIHEGFYVELKKNLTEVMQAIRIPIFYKVVLFLVLNGLLLPSFGSFGYYFMLDIVKISKFTIAMLGVLGYICLMIGSSVFQKYLTRKDFGTLIIYNVLIGMCFAPLNLLFVMRKNE
jgi:hypothetical protein